MRPKINLRDIQALTPREQEQFQRWLYYHLRKYIPKPEQVQARQEQKDEQFCNSQTEH